MNTPATITLNPWASVNDNERPADVDHNDLAQLNNVLWAMAKAERRDQTNA